MFQVSEKTDCLKVVVFVVDLVYIRTIVQFHYLALLTITSLVMSFLLCSIGCPDKCNCSRWPSNPTKISVVGKGLSGVPTSFPPYTSAIYVTYSYRFLSS